MRVEGFFTYITERYPCVSETIEGCQIPEFENLYLDMNGIIHKFFQLNDEGTEISEKEMLDNLFQYLEELFSLVRPKKILFISIDGVAPRAKMNHQRGRKYIIAKEDYTNLDQKISVHLREKNIFPGHESFYSNCITPGTEFMEKLQKQLEFFIARKVSTDPWWGNTGFQVILSGHRVPGEGKDKIMEFIRFQRSQPDYSTDTRHCLYGKDSDFIMLGLCSHEPHFCILSDQVKVRFGREAETGDNPQKTKFLLLHLKMLRDYLDLEFVSVKRKLFNFPYDLEHLIDDWVLMAVLVGNDFIPSIPLFCGNKSVLQDIILLYMEVLPTLDGYINENGQLNLSRFEKLMKHLASLDLKYFNDVHADVRSPKKKHGRKRRGQQANRDEQRQKNFIAYKKAYYSNKMKLCKVDNDVIRSQAESYVTGIQWVLHHYYNGVCSWSWFYPNHYAPFVSDVQDFGNLELSYELGQPFLPFQQLLAVLPSSSKKLLPVPYHGLMSDENSPLSDFYPSVTSFETDLNGMKIARHAIALIPFIEEKRLIAAMSTCESQLTEQEQNRNCRSPVHIFDFCEEDLGKVFAPAYFPPLWKNHCVCDERMGYFIPPDKLVKGLHPKYNPDQSIPGVPSVRSTIKAKSLKKNKQTRTLVDAARQNASTSKSDPKKRKLTLPSEEAEVKTPAAFFQANKMSENQRWIPLESNPEVMNKFLTSVGVSSKWRINDVYGLDSELLATLPSPALAVLLLFPLNNKFESYFQKEEEAKKSESVSPSVYFMKQTVGNACGTIALIHAVANNLDRIDVSTGHLKNFLDATKEMTPDERAVTLEADVGLSSAHEESAQGGQTEAPSRDEKVNLHFIALVEKDGGLYELDGRKSRPVPHGKTTRETFLEDAAKVCCELMAVDPEEVHFALVALTAAE